MAHAIWSALEDHTFLGSDVSGLLGFYSCDHSAVIKVWSERARCWMADTDAPDFPRFSAEETADQLVITDLETGTEWTVHAAQVQQ